MMKNKYLYTFLKDRHLQWPVALTAIAAVLCLVLWQMAKQQEKELSALQAKKQVVAEIPKLQAQVAKLEASDGLLLTGIIFNKERPLAIINDKVLAVGDVIENKKVRAIWTTCITLCDNVIGGKCVDLKLEE
jgi:molybdenum cofactor biosynthesis enzyme